MQEGKRLSEIETARIDGEIKGKIKGKIEGKIEAAKLLKSEGVELAIISKTTGLSLGEIELL